MSQFGTKVNLKLKQEWKDWLTLPKTNSSPLKIGYYSNHPFSGANLLLVSGRVRPKPKGMKRTVGISIHFREAVPWNARGVEAMMGPQVMHYIAVTNVYLTPHAL